MGIASGGEPRPVNIEPNPRGLELMVKIRVPTDGRFPRGRMPAGCTLKVMTLCQGKERKSYMAPSAKVNVVAFALLPVSFLLTFPPAMDVLQGK